MNEDELRQAIVHYCKWLRSQNLNQVTTGNLSVRISAVSKPTAVNSAEHFSQTLPDLIGHKPKLAKPAVQEALNLEHLLITPSGQSYESLTSEMIVKMNFRGEWVGDFVPSSEWRFHIDILKARPDINAVVHTHSMFATIQSMTRQTIPASHYLMAMLGGNDVRCAPYARFGSQQLSDCAVAALDGRMACLLSNHGAIAVGKNLKQAVDNAVLLETLAQQYYFAKLAGACLLTASEIAETRQAMSELPAYKDRT